MQAVVGKYNYAKIYTDLVEPEALAQVKDICDMEIFADSRIRMMPDIHAGAGCTIGTTLTYSDAIVPNFVGVDIGCGMTVAKLPKKLTQEDLEKLDNIIKEKVPSGRTIRSKEHELWKYVREDIEKIIADIDMNRAKLSLGTLGGGNHFIEVSVDETEPNSTYIIVHSGSRYLGTQIASYWQNKAINAVKQNNKKVLKEIINSLKEEGRVYEINDAIKNFTENLPEIDKDLVYLTGDNFKGYINDMKIGQKYASFNRIAILYSILSYADFASAEIFETIHNYLDIENKILRKGAVAANKGETLLIPLNMADGSLLCIGKGNQDWNFSAPHGAGRMMSRTKAKENISLKEFQNSMTGIYTTSVCEATIDEAPMAYKPKETILENIKDTVEVKAILKPIYNYKAH